MFIYTMQQNPICNLITYLWACHYAWKAWSHPLGSLSQPPSFLYSSPRLRRGLFVRCLPNTLLPSETGLGGASYLPSHPRLSFQHQGQCLRRALSTRPRTSSRASGDDQHRYKQDEKQQPSHRLCYTNGSSVPAHLRQRKSSRISVITWRVKSKSSFGWPFPVYWKELYFLYRSSTTLKRWKKQR